MPTRSLLACLAGLVLLSGCTSPAADQGRRPAPGPVAPTAGGTSAYDCGRLVPGTSARLRGVAETCLRDALDAGHAARLVRVTGVGARRVETSYVVTGRRELSIEAAGRSRTCTQATGLTDLGRCSRDPGPGM